mgnify:CR=1 FL=1
MIDIVDTHLHIWDPVTRRLPWLDVEGPILNRAWSVADYQDAAARDHGYRIAQAVYIEVDIDPAEREAENEDIVDTIRRHDTPIVAACISGDLRTSQFAEYIGRWANNKEVKGVRQVLHVPSAKPGTCLSEQFAQNVRLLGKLGLVFEGCVRNPELPDLATLARRCPDTTIVLDHMGIVDADIMGDTAPTADERAYQERYVKNMRDLGSLDNVVCKVSGLNPVRKWSMESLQRSVDVAFETFPADRVMFASNFPVLNVSMTLDEWICSMLEISNGMGEHDRTALFSGNARRVYGI